MTGTTNIFGNFRATQAQAGVFQVVVSKSGYRTDTFSISLTNGVLLNKQFALLPETFSNREQNILNSVSIYPNPTRSIVKLRGLNGLGRNLAWSLVDLSGQVLRQGDLNIEKPEINFGTAYKGLYLLQLSSNTATKTYSISFE
jgi:hypothetical protein